MIFASTGVIVFLGSALAPFFLSIIIAYLLNGFVETLARYLPLKFAFYFVYLSFISFLLLTIFVLFPYVWTQFIHLIEELPKTFQDLQETIFHLPNRYPGFISDQLILDILATLTNESRLEFQ